MSSKTLTHINIEEFCRENDEKYNSLKIAAQALVNRLKQERIGPMRLHPEIYALEALLKREDA